MWSRAIEHRGLNSSIYSKHKLFLYWCQPMSRDNLECSSLQGRKGLEAEEMLTYLAHKEAVQGPGAVKIGYFCCFYKTQTSNNKIQILDKSTRLAF